MQLHRQLTHGRPLCPSSSFGVWLGQGQRGLTFTVVSAKKRCHIDREGYRLVVLGLFCGNSHLGPQPTQHVCFIACIQTLQTHSRDALSSQRVLQRLPHFFVRSNHRSFPQATLSHPTRLPTDVTWILSTDVDSGAARHGGALGKRLVA
jgi:hypothetical protein